MARFARPHQSHLGWGCAALLACVLAGAWRSPVFVGPARAPQALLLTVGEGSETVMHSKVFEENQMWAGVPPGGLLFGAALGAALGLSGRGFARTGAFTGAGSQVLPAAPSATPGFSGTVESLVTMGGVKRRFYVRHVDRTKRDRRREQQVNHGAAQRFLRKEDGSLWYRRPGVDKMRNKRSTRRVKAMQRMYKVDDSMKRRLKKLLHYRMPAIRPEDMIMRKFNERRLEDGRERGNRVGVHLWT